MEYKKKGYPEESDLVICTVKSILPHSVFVFLDEYMEKEGMIHISEIAPGRIRNLGDYVKVGKRVVCKVLRVNKDNGHIDLSLRRVNNFQYRSKNKEYSLETKAERVLEALALKQKTTLNNLYKEFGEKIIEEYGSLSICFEDVAHKGESVIKKIVSDKYLGPLLEIIKERIKVQEKEVEGLIEIQNSSENGIENIKEVLLHAEEMVKKKNYKIMISYISAPKYRIVSTAFDYSTANSNINEIAEEALKENKSFGGRGSFKLREKK